MQANYEEENHEQVFQHAFHTNCQTIKEKSKYEEEELEEREIIDEINFMTSQRRSNHSEYFADGVPKRFNASEDSTFCYEGTTYKPDLGDRNEAGKAKDGS